MTDLFTNTIEPFTAVNDDGHEVLVLAGVFELRRPEQTNAEDPVARFLTREHAKTWQDKCAARGIELRLSVHVIDSVDFTAVVGWSSPLDDLDGDDDWVMDDPGWTS